MRDVYITIHYEDTEWKDDIAQFALPQHITPQDVIDKIEQYSAKNRPSEDEGKLEYTQRIVLDAAQELGGSVYIFTIHGTLTIV